MNILNQLLTEAEAIITKPVIKAELKKIKLQNVSVLAKAPYGTKPVAYKPNGKLILGIKLASHSPMDATSAANNKIKQLSKEVIEHLRDKVDVESKNDLIYFTANKGTKKEFKIVASVSQYPTYDRSMNRDRDYVTSWLVFNFDAK